MTSLRPAAIPTIAITSVLLILASSCAGFAQTPAPPPAVAPPLISLAEARVIIDGAIVGLGRPLADGSRIDDLSQSALGSAAFGLAHLPRRTQVRHQRLLQHAAGLDKETPIDRFVRYLHAWGGRELPLQPARDLLRRPLEHELLRDAPS